MLQAQATDKPVSLLCWFWCVFFGFVGLTAEVLSYHAVLSSISSVISDENHSQGHSDHLSEIPLEGHQNGNFIPFLYKEI